MEVYTCNFEGWQVDEWITEPGAFSHRRWTTCRFLERSGMLIARSVRKPVRAYTRMSYARTHVPPERRARMTAW